MDNSRDAQHNDVSFLLFRAQGRLCALPIAQVVETMRPLPIEPFANAPFAVKGVAVVRGLPLPVVEVAMLLGGAASFPTRFVIVRSTTGHVVLAVESVLGLFSISSAILRQWPALLGETDNNVVSAIGTLDAELLLLLNTARLLPDNVWPAQDAGGAPQ